MIKKHKLLFITTIFIMLLIEGCNQNRETKSSTHTVIGKSTSITTDIQNVTMAIPKQAKEDVTRRIASMIQLQINNFNQKEAISLDSETNYCDISGLKKIEYSQNKSNIVTLANYKSCQDEKNIQNGQIKTLYSSVNEDNQFPKSLKSEIISQSKWNHITLQKGLVIEANNLLYNQDKSLKSMKITVKGETLFFSQKITLREDKLSLEF